MPYVVWADDTWLQKHAGATLTEEGEEKADTEDNEKGTSITQVGLCHSLSLSVILTLSLCHLLSLSVSLGHSQSLLVALSHSQLLSITLSHSLSLSVTLSFCARDSFAHQVGVLLQLSSI